MFRSERRTSWGVGFASTHQSADQFRAKMRLAAAEFARTKPLDEAIWTDFASRLDYVPGRISEPSSMRRLKEKLEALDRERGTRGNRIYYLAIPPSLFGLTARSLSDAGLVDDATDRERYTRIVIEKPFGRDLSSAQALDHELHAVFKEPQIFRVDHYATCRGRRSSRARSTSTSRPAPAAVAGSTSVLSSPTRRSRARSSMPSRARRGLRRPSKIATTSYAHAPAAGYTLGLEAKQVVANAAAASALDRRLVAPIDRAKHMPLAGTKTLDRSLDERARGYLHANCSMCHRDGSATGLAELDLRVDLPLDRTGLCLPPKAGASDLADPRVVVPGAPERSVLPHRMKSLGADARMPKLGSHVIDDEAVLLVEQWSGALTACP